MIHDICMFAGESEMLKCRLTELWDVVGRFHIVEAPLTLKGEPKPLYFADNKSEYSPWLEKIESIVIENMPTERSFPTEPADMFSDAAWKREWFQMDAALSRFRMGDTEALIYSDCDEIPRASAVKRFTVHDTCVTLLMSEFSFYLNWKLPSIKSGPVIVIGREINAGRKRANIRHEHGGFARNRGINDAGWHFSSMGGPEAVKRKLQSFCHWNRKCVLEYTNLPEPKDSPIPKTWEGGQITKVKIDQTYPKYVRDNVAALIEKGFLHQPLL